MSDRIEPSGPRPCECGWDSPRPHNSASHYERMTTRLLARIEALTLAGDGLAECVIPYRSNATRLAAWKKEAHGE